MPTLLNMQLCSVENNTMCMVGQKGYFIVRTTCLYKGATNNGQNAQLQDTKTNKHEAQRERQLTAR